MFRPASPTAYVFDKDGTLVTDGEAVEGARTFLQELHDDGTPYAILSNTGELDGERATRKLSATLGIEIPAGRVCTARDHMRETLLRQPSPFARIYTVGCGVDDWPPLRYHDAPPDDASDVCVAVFSDGYLPEFCLAVMAIGAWVTRGAHLWVTSSDESVATRASDGRAVLRPGPGAIVQAVRCVVPRPMRRVRTFGKGGDDPTLAESVLEVLHRQGFRGSPRDVLMVGDRFDTDVRAGRRCGWSTCLVESGCHTLEDARMYPADVADTVASSIGDLLAQRSPSAHRSITDLVRDVTREALRRSPQSNDLATWISGHLHRIATRLDEAIGIHPPPRRIRSYPDVRQCE